jgi:Tfp pilus assembly protein PilW
MDENATGAMRRQGMTLIEMMVALVIAILGIFAVSSLLVIGTRDWLSSRGVVSLQVDLDVASYTIKGILEEASDVTITENGSHLSASYGTAWSKEFYPDASVPSNLIMRDMKSGNSGYLIRCLSSISFEQVDSARIRVNISVQQAGKTLQNSFVVDLKNQGYS